MGDKFVRSQAKGDSGPRCAPYDRVLAKLVEGLQAQQSLVNEIVSRAMDALVSKWAVWVAGLLMSMIILNLACMTALLYFFLA